MGTNQIYQWAVTSDANTMSDATYQVAVSSGGSLVGGVVSGQASSLQANKTWRQALTPASGLSQFLADTLDVTVTDLDSPTVFSARITQAIETVTASTCLQLSDTTTQTVAGPVSFKGLITVPIVSDWSTTQVVGASDVKSSFVKQGWGFSNFGNNAIYLGWRADGSGLGIGIDSTDEGNVAVQGAGKLGKGGWTEQYYTLTSQGSKTISLTFDAPSAGYVHVVGSANFAAQNTNQSQLSIVINGTTLSADNVTNSTAMTNHSCVLVSAGTVTVGSFLSTSATNPPNVGHTLSYIFIPS